LRSRNELRIDWVAPPFAGHLFPLLALASGLAARGFSRQRVLSTEGARASVEALGLVFMPLLGAREREVFEIANTARRVAGAPHRMLRQLRQNLALCLDSRAELEALWGAERPDIVIADFTMPFAGHLAEALGARWWTTTPSPCALETRTGTPAYLGGWRDHGEWWSRLRDRCGNLVVHHSKRALARLVRPELQRLGVHRIHREDGTEVVYSTERIFALGAREFELSRSDWPRALEFIGPVPASAPRSVATREPTFEAGRVHVLVSLGTHLAWAKRRAAELSMEAARALPEWRFHYTLGRAALGEVMPGAADCIDGMRDVPSNWQAFDYIPYDERLAHYDLALIHGGTGIAYACLARGVPVVVWPHDYDQFDHAVRIETLGAGRRLHPRRVVQDLVAVHGDPSHRASARRMQTVLMGYDPVRAVEARLDEVLNPQQS
jgi:UDP:flavonoid glycosyltransferase YjiC (YdhE family)